MHTTTFSALLRGVMLEEGILEEEVEEGAMYAHGQCDSM